MSWKSVTKASRGIPCDPYLLMENLPLFNNLFKKIPEQSGNNYDIKC